MRTHWSKCFAAQAERGNCATQRHRYAARPIPASGIVIAPAADTERRLGFHMRIPNVLSLIGIAVLGALVLSSAAQAQRSYERDRYQRYERYDRGRNVAGQFDYYALVLSWSPTHCASEEARNGGSELQCNRRDGRRYNFVLHGLWPQYERGFPGDCPTRERPYVPERLIDSMLEIMPARGLIIHEYRKHGTCSGLTPTEYYELARRLFTRIRIPQRYVNPFDVQFVSPEQLMKDLAAENPGLEPDMMAVSCGGPGNRLREVRICFSKSGALRACGGNENQRRMCSARQMYVPPVRSLWKSPKARDAVPAPRREERSPPQRDYLPGPRGI